MKDLIKENGNQATIGIIPQLFINFELFALMRDGSASWEDLEAAGITETLLEGWCKQRIVPRLVVDVNPNGYLVVGSGSGAVSKAKELHCIAGALGLSSPYAIVFHWLGLGVPTLELITGA